MDDNKECKNEEIMQPEKEEMPAENKGYYSAYEYLKKHPAMVLSILSAFVAIITFFANACVFFHDRALLSYWNFDIEYVETGKISSLYTIGGAFICSILFSITAIWYNATYETYLYRKKVNYYAKTAVHNIRITIWKMRKTLLRLYLFLLFFLMITKINDCHESIKICRENIESYRLDITRSKKLAKACNYGARVLKKAYLADFLKNVLPVYILWLIISLCYSLIEMKNNSDLLIGTLVFFTCGFLTFWGVSCFKSAKVINRKEIKNSIKSTMREGRPDKMVQSVSDDVKKNDYPLDVMAQKGIKSLFSNATILVVLVSVVISGLVSLLTNAIVDYERIKNETNFKIVSIEEEQYAIIYQGQDKYYLEKAVITDDIIAIDTRQQRIISTSDISFSIRTFDKVIKIDREVPQ